VVSPVQHGTVSSRHRLTAALAIGPRLTGACLRAAQRPVQVGCVAPTVGVGPSATAQPRHTITSVLAALSVGVMAYLLGSIPFAFLIARRVGLDLRTTGSGNVGATNLLRTSDWPRGLLAALLDAAKGAVAVLAAERWAAGAALVSAAGVFAVLGHIAPVWLRFRGGKGVATGVGVLAVLAPGAAAIGVAIFVVTVWATRYVSLGSCMAVAGVVLATAVGAQPAPVLVASLIIGGLVLVRHRENIARLRTGREPRLGEYRAVAR
jgi:glycerol-3-phosphate acyltransferase PlsY